MRTVDDVLVQKESKLSGMRCLIKESLDQDGLNLKTGVEIPELKSDEVRIKVLATAVCGTDKSIYHSSNSEGIRLEMQRYLSSASDYEPIIVGHEFCGVIDELGAGVQADRFPDVPSEMRLERGDYVTAEMHLSCGHCLLCRTGNEHICTRVKVKGVHLDGCFAQYVTVPYKNVILLGKDGDQSQIPPRVGAMLDAFGNAVHTVYEADVRGKSVAILGAGPLGLMATFLCREFGAARIYLTEAADVDKRFALATKFGAEFCFDVGEGSQKLYDEVERRESMANGVDVVLEMSGSPSAYRDAFRIVRNGGTVLLLGITRKPLTDFDIANGVIWKGVTVKGIFGRKMFDTWETMLRLLKADHLDLQSKLDDILCQKNYKLEEHEPAFKALSNGEMKLVFVP
jgi:Threonine dehydrogenase and related Zn-dependent dehydrogenases